ncbi:MAG TPA: hypothetical protein VGC67_13270 [Cellulomonas sp.]
MAHTLRRSTLALLSGLSVAVTVAACGSTDTATDDTDQTTTQTQDDTSTSDGSASTGSDSTATEQAGTDDSAADDSAADDTSDSTYTDGTYTAEGSYSSPGGTESIEVELTVTDDVVTAVTVTPEATSSNASRYQEDFASAIADEVVGQELATLSVSKVSGSSLTGDGFNAALDQIRSDASA